jgi:hypothetical protein
MQDPAQLEGGLGQCQHRIGLSLDNSRRTTLVEQDGNLKLRVVFSSLLRGMIPSWSQVWLSIRD